MLKFIYYGVTLVLCFPIIVWNAIVSLILFDSRYWDDCMSIIPDLLDVVNNYNKDTKPKRF